MNRDAIHPVGDTERSRGERGDCVPTTDSLAWAALQQYQRAEMWIGIANDRMKLLIATARRCHELDRKWKEALAFGVLVGAAFGAVSGLIYGFFHWGMK